MRLLLVSILFSVVHLSGSTGSSLNELTAISYSDLSQKQGENLLELGSVTLSCKEKPRVVIQDMQQTADNGHIELFCPLLESKHDNKSINMSQHIPFNLLIEKVEQPCKGIKLTIRYNPEKVRVSCDEFVESDSGVGFVVRLYDQDILSRLNNHTVHMLRLV